MIIFQALLAKRSLSSPVGRLGDKTASALYFSFLCHEVELYSWSGGRTCEIAIKGRTFQPENLLVRRFFLIKEKKIGK